MRVLVTFLVERRVDDVFGTTTHAGSPWRGGKTAFVYRWEEGSQADLALNKDNLRFQRLVVEYKENEDPDDGYNQVPYEKGSNFLLHLERTVGGLDHFIPYMKDYVKTFNGTSITTDQWRSHLFHYFGRQADSASYLKKLGKVDWDAWLHGDGPDLCVDLEYDDSLSKPAMDLAERWNASRSEKFPSEFSLKDVEAFSTSQKG